MFSYRIIYYIKYIIYNLKERYLFDFQRDKNFNLGKTVFLIMLHVISVTIVTKMVTMVTMVTPKNVTIILIFLSESLENVFNSVEK